MLRVNVHIDKQAVTLQMEGRFAGQMIPEAERCWEAARIEYPDRPLRVDLRAVTFIDQEGMEFLKQVYREGTSFLCSGCLTRAYVEEVMRSVQESNKEGRKGR